MEGLTFITDNFSFSPNAQGILPMDSVPRGNGPELATEVIQNFIVKHLDDNRIELISCDAQHNIQCLPQEAGDPRTVPNWNWGEFHDGTPQNTPKESFKRAKTPNRERPILSKPERIIVDVTIYSCFKCSEQFNSLTLFRQHLKWHQTIKNFNCLKCSTGFNEENNLLIHMVTSHPGISDVCPICHIEFQRKASLRSHIMLHQVEELFLCEECQGEFQNDDELLKHMESHATTKVTRSLSESLVCPYCKLEYKTLAEYKQHIARHVEVKKNILKGKKVRKRKLKENGRGSCKCKYCGKAFPKVCLLARHERIHTGEKPFKCQFCDKAFAQKGTLQVHLDKHTGLKAYSCTLCSAAFSQKGNLRAHVEKTHTVPKGGHKVYRCSQCTCIFRKIASLNGHVTKMHLNQPEEEPLGSKNIIDKVMDSLRELHSELGKSALKQDEPRPEVAPPANIAGLGVVRLAEGQESGGLKRYTVRQKKIGDVRWYFCNHCSRRFKKPSDLIRHFRTHTMEKPFSCSKCNQSFSLKSTLISHYKVHEKPGCHCDYCDCTGPVRGEEKADNRNYVCLLCERTFTTFQEAKNHRPEHEGEMQSTQNIIEPLLHPVTSNDTLQSKTSKPTEPNPGPESPLERPHQCKICDARFSRLMSLKRHMVHHSGERKFKCNMCPKAFVSKYRLKEHQNFHKNVKNFACPTCGKKFVTSSLLKRHSAVHNKQQRPYMCHYCDKRFKTLLLFKSHIGKVHKGMAVEEIKEISVETSATALENVIVDDIIASADTIEPVAQEPLLLSQPNNSEITTSVLTPQTPPPDYQMVYLNIADLPTVAATNPLNGDSLIKLPNDAYLFNDLHESGDVLFSIDALKTTQMVDPNDVIKSLSDPTELAKPESVPVQVNFGGLPINVIDATDPAGELIPLDAQVICINCHKMFSNYYVFERHACTDDAAAQTQDHLKLFIQEGVGSDDFAAKVYNVSDGIAPSKSEVYENRALITTTENRQQINMDLDKMRRFRYKKPLMLDVQRLEDKPRQFACKQCNFVTSFDDRFRKHLLLHPDMSEKICRFCLKDFKKLSDLKRHLRTHTGEKPFECERCRKKFSLKSTLESHMRTHDVAGVSRISCDVCNSNFTSKSSLKVHMLLHTGVRPHACSFCDQTFRTSAIRKAHEKSLHLPKIGQSTAAKPKLGGAKLMKSVAEEALENMRKEAMDEDDRDTSVNRLEPAITTDRGVDLINPEPITHSGGDPMFFVQQLDNSEIIISPLPINLDEIAVLDVVSPNLPEMVEQSKKHPTNKAAAVNQKQPRVECDICHKLYSSRDVLRKHKRTLHGQNRKYPCIKCDKGYDQLEELNKHIAKLHTGSRPYACQYCANSFSEENSLKTHIKRIHQKSLVGQETTNALLGLQYALTSGDNFL